MTQWNLSRIRYAIRKLTGKLDNTQIADSSSDAAPISATNQPGIDDYINDFYLYDMDEVFRTLKLKTFYEFATSPNIGTYDFPNDLYFEATPPIYVDGYQIAWYQDPDLFYRIWPELGFIQQGVAIGNGGATYTFTFSQTPIQQNTVQIGTTPASASILDTFTDSPTNAITGQLISSVTGAIVPGTSINYQTGVVTVIFSAGLPVGTSINAHYYPYVASRPRDCLFFSQKFNFKPIPNDVYKIRVVAYQKPTTALGATQFGASTSDAPLFNEWWQMIAYGAAVKILAEEGDYEEAERVKAYYDEARRIAQRRAIRQLSTQRIQTAYSDNNVGPTFPIFPFY